MTMRALNRKISDYWATSSTRWP